MLVSELVPLGALNSYVQKTLLSVMLSFWYVGIRAVTGRFSSRILFC